MVYFGTIDGPLARMQELPGLLSPVEVSYTKHTTESQFLNGRTSVVSSADSTKRIGIRLQGSFNDDELNQNIDILKDYYDGVYGDGLIYLDDPTIPRGRNVLRTNWATPALGEIGYQLKLDRVYTDSALYGEYVDVTAGYGSPGRALKIMRAGEPTANPPNYGTFLWSPIVVPEGFTFYLSFRGERVGGGLAFYDMTETSPTTFNIVPSPPGDNGLFIDPSQKIEGPAVIAITASVAGADPETSHLTLQSLDAIILPNGVTPPATGDHQVGNGSSGFKFNESMTHEYRSAHTGYRVFETELVEVGEWMK